MSNREKRKLEQELDTQREIMHNIMLRQKPTDKAKEWFKRPAYSVPFKKQED